MKIEQIPVADLVLDDKNARAHSERNVDAIAASLETFGQQKPVVVNKGNHVVAGNGTVMAAEKLGWEKLACVRTGLDEKLQRGFAVADNRTAELAEWDWQQLAAEIRLLEGTVTLEQMGWLEYEVEPFMQADWEPPEPTPDNEGDGGNGAATRTVHVTAEQYEMLAEAANHVRQRDKLEDASMGDCLCVVCREFLGASK